jgi:hypothetical protein
MKLNPNLCACQFGLRDTNDRNELERLDDFRQAITAVKLSACCFL